MGLNSITSGVVGYWPLEEPNGTRFDQSGSGNALSGVNTVGSAVAVIGSGAHFIRANSETLRAFDNEVLNFGDEDFTLSCWVSLDTKDLPAQTILGKVSPQGDNRQYFVDYVGGGIDRFRLLASPDGINGSQVLVEADNFGSPTANELVFIIAWHDSVANTINIQVNDGTTDSVAYSVGVFQSEAIFSIGSDQDSNGNPRFFLNGIVDEVAAWERVLTTDEKTCLYNGGSGVNLNLLLNPVIPVAPGSGANLENISDGNPYIAVSGAPIFADEIRWPFGSGVNTGGNVGFSEDLDACLIDLNAQFGFNQQPHRFNMTWAVKCPDFDTIVNSLPPIGDEVFFNIGRSEFLIRGRLVHTDITKSSRGYILTTTVEDFRPDLSRISIDTYGLYDVNEAADVNVIDVHHWFLTTQDGQDNPRQLRMLRENGATYSQIYDAINDQNSFLGSRIPTPAVLQQNLPEDIDSYRFTFRTTPALDALVKIFTDVSFDLYWNMGEDELNVVNRKEQIDLSLNEIPFSEDDPNNPITPSLKFGKDEGERPTAVQVLGERMEGVIGNGGVLKSTGGTYDSNIQLDLSEDATWLPGWRNATIFYFGEDGTLKEDVPTDEELSASLKGIEYWTLIKNQNQEQSLESRLAIQSIDFRDGIQYSVIRAATPSGIGLVANRGQDGRSWIIEWYNKIRNFAQNHFTRTYVLDSSSTLFSQLDRFDVVNEAWTSLENQVEGDPNYNTGYKIDPQFRWLSPFWNEDDNKLRSWATINHTDAIGGSAAPLWGLDGKGVPTQFEEWNEEFARIYIPIQVEKWNRSSSKFDSDFILEAQKSPRGMLIRFPNIMWETFERSEFFIKFPALVALDNQFLEDSTDDLPIGPADQGVPYEFFTQGINIAVRTFERYGSTKPSAWTAGSPLSTTVRRTRTEVIQRDDLAPWNFEPISVQSSVDQLDNQGVAAAQARAVNRSEVTFAEATKVGLPIISFDEYAVDGCAKNGITNLSLSFNASAFWQTRYSAKTHFPQPIKVKPVREETMEDFRFALHRVNQLIAKPLPRGPFQPPPLFDPKTNDGREFVNFPKKESLQIPIIIDEIISFINEQGNADLAYAGEDARGLKWPASRRLQLLGGLNPNSKIGRNPNAICIDGLLQKGMQAVYFYEDLGDGEFNHYFRGGISLTVARIVTSLGVPKVIEGISRMDVEIPATTLSVPVYDSNRTQQVVTDKISLLNVPFSDQQNVDATLNTGSKVLIGGPGVENGAVLKPAKNLSGNFEVDVSEGENKDQTFILTGGRAGAGTLFATITVRPNDITGRGATIETLSSIAGTTFEDSVLTGASEGVPGTRFFVDFVGIEFSQITLGDTAMVTQEVEENEDPENNPVVIRLLTYIPKPLFMSTDALGGSVG